MIISKVLANIAIIENRTKIKKIDKAAYMSLYKSYCELKLENEKLKEQIKRINIKETEVLNNMTMEEHTRYMNTVIFP